jgi:hypothetical protein
MSIIDEIMERYNVKYEDLHPDERETLNGWLESLQQGELTLDKIRGYLANMKGAVEQELTKTGHESKQDLFLKARLRNYLLLEAFLSTPEKAKEQMDKAIAGFASRIKI